MRKYNLPIFIPHRGCPHDCAFCNQKKITGVETEVSAEDVRQMIADFLKTIDSVNSSVEVGFFGGSFTGLDVKTQETLLGAASEFFPRIDGIRLSTRPDYIDEDILSVLKKYGVTTVELGVQSSNDRVLEMNCRGHDFRSVERASRLIKDSGIRLGHQMMLGMYGSDPEVDMKTVEDIIALGPECVRIYPVVTLKGTRLEKIYSSGEYEPYSVELAAQLAKTAVKKFRAANIEVIRMGLHASEELDEADGTVVAGPYHPAFGEIVESLLMRELIEKELEKNQSNGEFVFYCKKNEVSKAVGHKGMNKEYFDRKYNLKLKVKTLD